MIINSFDLNNRLQVIFVTDMSTTAIIIIIIIIVVYGF